MLKKLNNILFISLSLFLLAGCNFDIYLDDSKANTSVETKANEETTETSHDPSAQIESLSELIETEHFRGGALAHIFEGELNRKGQAVGFHYDGLPTKIGEIIQGTETKPNKFGVFEAEITVSGVAKTSNNGRSTFFPREWDAQQVVDAINEAYEVRTFISGNTYEGLTPDGMRIRMYLDENERIISAFPIY